MPVDSELMFQAKGHSLELGRRDKGGVMYPGLRKLGSQQKSIIYTFKSKHRVPE